MTNTNPKTINEEEFPSNSIINKTGIIRDFEKSKQHQINALKSKKKIQPKAIIKKPSFMDSLSDTFFGEGARYVISYVFNDVLIPAAKKTIQDMVETGISIFLYGDEDRSSRRNRSTRDGRSIISYGNFYRSNDEEDTRRYSNRDRFNLSDITFRSGQDASEVLDQMREILDTYSEITVADYYDLAGIDGATHVHNKWGWRNLSKARCAHTRDGYTIILPSPKELS